jgi:hypothetical protein
MDENEKASTNARQNEKFLWVNLYLFPFIPKKKSLARVGNQGSFINILS